MAALPSMFETTGREAAANWIATPPTTAAWRYGFLGVSSVRILRTMRSFEVDASTHRSISGSSPR